MVILAILDMVIESVMVLAIAIIGTNNDTSKSNTGPSNVDNNTAMTIAISVLMAIAVVIAISMV